ncbi:MAG: alcohol dehydrogenase catalytic domain-containing protein, partial [Gammaproteobacteria bacterium]
MQTTMKALVKNRAEAGIWLASVPVPSPATNEVLIRVHMTGICGTDLHIYKWDEWSQNRLKPPVTTGHE